MQRVKELEEENEAFRYEIKLLSSSLEIDKEFREHPTFLVKELAELREKCAQQARTEEDIQQQFTRVDAQLRGHTRGAIRVGCTPTEILETVIHVVQYAGFPRALNAIRIVTDQLVELGCEIPAPLGADG